MRLLLYWGLNWLKGWDRLGMQEETMWMPHMVNVLTRAALLLRSASAVPPDLCTGHFAREPSALTAEGQDRAKDFHRVIFACLRGAVSL